MRQQKHHLKCFILLSFLSTLLVPSMPVLAGFSFQNQSPPTVSNDASSPDHPAHGLQRGPVDLLLVPTSVTLADKNVLVGQQTRISALVVNQDTAAQNRVRVRFSCGSMKKEIFIRLGPKQRQHIHADITIPGPAGQKTIRVEVNPVHRELAERNYSNNIGRVNVTVREKSNISQQQSPSRPHPSGSGSFSPLPSRPDLELVAHSVKVIRKNIVTGQQVTVSALAKNRAETGLKPG